MPLLKRPVVGVHDVVIDFPQEPSNHQIFLGVELPVVASAISSNLEWGFPLKVEKLRWGKGEGTQSTTA